MSFKASSKVGVPFLLASLGFFALHCSSDDGTPAGGGGSAGQATSGSGGAGGSSAGMTSGGTSSGSSSGGSATGGNSGSAGQAGSAGAAGSGGTSGGAGGSGGAAGGGAGGGGAGGKGGSGGGGGAAGNGGSGGSGGSGGGGATFAQVQQLLAMSCKGAMCHNAGVSKHLDFVTAGTLYNNLTMPVPAGDVCAGDTPVVKNNPDGSLIVKVVKASGEMSCGGGGKVGKMPDRCGQAGGGQCLTDQQIKLITDWISAGAPM